MKRWFQTWRHEARFVAALGMAAVFFGVAEDAGGGESWHVAPGAGALFFPGGQPAREDPAATLRFGYDLDAPFSLELGGLAGTCRDHGNPAGLYGSWIDGIVHLARWERLDPFLSAGVGSFWSDNQVLPNDRQATAAPRLGAGVLYTLSEHWSLRAGVTAMTVFPCHRDTAFAVAELGLSYYFGDTTPERPEPAN